MTESMAWRTRMPTSAIAVGAVLLASGCAPPGPRTSAYDGVYAGTSQVIENISDACFKLPPVDDFRVVNGEVRYYGYIGYVRPNGTVTMQSGDSYVLGKFTANHFQGHTYAPGSFCAYELSLNRTS